MEFTHLTEITINDSKSLKLEIAPSLITAQRNKQAAQDKIKLIHQTACDQAHSQRQNSQDLPINYGFTTQD